MRWLAVAAALLFANCPACAGGQDSTIQFKLRGRIIEGGPLTFSDESVQMLGRDGHWWSFAPHEATESRKTANGFQSYSTSEMRGVLLREFGQGFEVSGTGHYLVVHPSGRNPWASRFEELYGGFVHYFTARGWVPQSPQFPLVAVVFATQTDFQRYAVREGSPVSAGLRGYYSQSSNRILMYDVTTGRKDVDWTANATTIIHEAAHQTAFNTGVHSRFEMPPRWVGEGLATMFEARGVWDSRRNTKPADRQNRERLEAFKKYAASRRKVGALAEFVSSDRLFQTDLDAAYAEAWALSFFLAETEPRKYVAYLQRTAARPNFTPYSAPERLQDFTATFGDKLQILEAHLLRFIAEIK